MARRPSSDPALWLALRQARDPRHSPLWRLLDRLETQPLPIRAGAGLAVVTAIAVVDYQTGPGISISFFYMAPIALASWMDGFWAGLLTSLLCDLVWGFNNVLAQGIPEAWGVPVWNTLVRLGSFLVVTLTISALRRALDREEAVGRTDPLTGLMNPRGFREAAEHGLAWQRRSRQPLSVVLLDLDNFKEVNDEQGHAEGDRLLATVAAELGAAVRATDTIGRIGGDEMAILLPATDVAGAEEAVEKLHRRLRQAAMENGWPVDASIGWATFREPPASLDAALRIVDGRMYAAKAAGKGRALGGEWP